MTATAQTGLESKYRGVVFRSRLEARWAALFDHYSITWAYEPDVFETPDGPYLPDFLLPDLGAYVEVKPEPLAFKFRAVRSIVERTGNEFLILDSPVVRCRAYAFMAPDGRGESEFFANWRTMVWCLSEKYLGDKPHDGQQRWYVEDGYSDLMGASAPCPHCQGLRFEPECFNTIRSMRFERGHAA